MPINYGTKGELITNFYLCQLDLYTSHSAINREAEKKKLLAASNQDSGAEEERKMREGRKEHEATLSPSSNERGGSEMKKERAEVGKEGRKFCPYPFSGTQQQLLAQCKKFPSFRSFY